MGGLRSGELVGDRTRDPRIKSALLYQLSYELKTVLSSLFCATYRSCRLLLRCTGFGEVAVLVAVVYRGSGCNTMQNSHRRSHHWHKHRKRLLMVFVGQVRVPLCHFQRRVSHQFAHLIQGYTSDDKPRSECMAQSMPVNVFDAHRDSRLLERRFEPFAGVLDLSLKLRLSFMLRQEDGRIGRQAES